MLPVNNDGSIWLAPHDGLLRILFGQSKNRIQHVENVERDHGRGRARHGYNIPQSSRTWNDPALAFESISFLIVIG